MSIKPPAPFNSLVGLVYLVAIFAAFTFAYNKSAQVRHLLGGKA